LRKQTAAAFRVVSAVRGGSKEKENSKKGNKIMIKRKENKPTKETKLIAEGID
jgi:hypothetical protein